MANITDRHAGLKTTKEMTVLLTGKMFFSKMLFRLNVIWQTAIGQYIFRQYVIWQNPKYTHFYKLFAKSLS